MSVCLLTLIFGLPSLTLQLNHTFRLVKQQQNTKQLQDLLLWEGHRLIGKRWVEISTKFFKGSRSENHIKNRWYSAAFKKFIAKEMGPDAYRLGNDGVSHDRKKRKTEVVSQLRGLVRSHGAQSSRPPVNEHYSEGYHEGRTSSGGHYYET